MIFNADWRNTFTRHVLPRLSVIHADMSRIAAALRNVNVDIWTEAPSDGAKLTPGRQHYSLEGWRVHYTREFATLNAFRAAHAAALDGYDPQANTALSGYVASMPAIGAAFAAVMDQYEDAEGRLIQALVTQAHRDSIAAVIEAELQ